MDSLDHESTWLLGHTQNITFGRLWEDEGDLYVDAVLHVGCRSSRGKATAPGASCTASAGRLPWAPDASRPAAAPGR